jgi:hypothetical protein
MSHESFLWCFEVYKPGGSGYVRARKVKVKVTLEHAMKAQRGSRGIIIIIIIIIIIFNCKWAVAP